MKRNSLLVVVLPVMLLIIFYAGCKSPTGPVELQPGRRDYTWTVDTLNVPYRVLEDIWGSSPTDLWCVGPGNDNPIYHFNGQKWTDYDIPPPSLSPTAVFGFSENNVWFGGTYGDDIWHYDGSVLSRFQNYAIPGYPLTGIQNIWGDNPNNVFAVGFADSSNISRGVIQHFDGSSWKIVYMTPLVSIREAYIRIFRNNISNDHNYYLLSFYAVDADSAKICQYDGENEVKEIYSSVASQANLSIINNEVYFTLGNQICIRQNNAFSVFLSVPGNNFLGGIGGRNNKDIILEMKDGIAHYNGNNIEYLYHFNHPGISISGYPVIFEKEVFILAYDFQNNLNLIFRGELK